MPHDLTRCPETSPDVLTHQMYCHTRTRRRSEMQKVKTFTLAAFWGPKNLRQKCVIRDKFNAIKSAWFATNWILKRLKKHYLCSKFKKKPWNYIQSAKYLQFMNIIKCTIIRCLVFSDSANIYTQNCVIRDKVIFLHHHLSRSPSEFLHQLGLFYTSSVSTVSTFCLYPVLVVLVSAVDVSVHRLCFQ